VRVPPGIPGRGGGPGSGAAPPPAPAGGGAGAPPGPPPRPPPPPPRRENFNFETDVARMLEIIVHSLYSNKDVFLRGGRPQPPKRLSPPPPPPLAPPRLTRTPPPECPQVISNASDAIDKISYLNASNPGLLGDTTDLEIRIRADKEARTLEIRDTGIGMTKADLIKNLGTIAKSGTSAFVDEFLKSNDSSLIGQFGVGFYSVYLVADKVDFISKHNDDTQHVWTSDGQGAFTVAEMTDPEEQLGRGSLLRLHLKEDAEEYMEERKIRDLVKHYSQYIQYPILLETEKEVEKEVPVSEVDGSDDGVEDEDAAKTKTVMVKEKTWERLNETQALWTRKPQSVDKEEYATFWKEVSKTSEDPITHSHFEVDGSDVNFKALLFIPPTAPANYYDSFYTRTPDIRLYVRRVFITDDFEDLMPAYLNFLWGVVDSDTLPLNVSRETLQTSQALKVIKRRLIKQALDMILKIHTEDERRIKDGEITEDERKYDKFWNVWGKSLKLGLADDTANRHRIAKLLRVRTSKSDGKLISLDTYVKRMKDGQKNIFFLSGDSVKEIEDSPLIERLLAKDFEVIYFTEPVDEILIQHLDEYDEVKFQNAAKEDMRMDDRDERDEYRKVSKDFKELTQWWKTEVAKKDSLMDDVKITTRLTKTPCIIVSATFGWSAHMEKIMMAQALGDPSKQQYMRSRKILEINPKHPMIQYIREQWEEDKENPDVALMAYIMYNTALLESGYEIENPHEYAKGLYKLMNTAMDAGIDLDADFVTAEDDAETVGGDAEAAEGDAEAAEL